MNAHNKYRIVGHRRLCRELQRSYLWRLLRCVYYNIVVVITQPKESYFQFVRKVWRIFGVEKMHLNTIGHNKTKKAVFIVEKITPELVIFMK